VYGVLAVATGGWFLLMAHRLHRAVRRGEPARPMRLFHLSNSYLTALFVAIAVDAVLGLPSLF
jgi:protoheme IX farnesyltransferase